MQGLRYCRQMKIRKLAGRSIVQPDKVAVVMTAVGGASDYMRYSLPSVVRYCDKFGYDFRYVDHVPVDDRHPSWQKLLAFHVVPKHVQLAVLIDSDIFVTPWAEPIHKYAHKSKLGITFSSHFECGFMTLPRCHRKWAEDLYAVADYKKSGSWYEQKYVNESIKRGEVPVGHLDPRWNAIVTKKHVRSKKLIAKRKDRYYMLHPAGQNAPKNRILRQAFEFFGH